ncbi:hypothetical protein [Tardisphaera saccharovorans]
MDYRTTHVGSLPRPPDLNQSNVEKAIEEIVKVQIETGVDEVNDGEYRRSIFFGDISGLPGFAHGDLVWTASAGDSVKVAVPVEKIKYDFSHPVLGNEVKAIRAVLDKLGVKRRVKVTAPALSLMVSFYPDPSVSPARPREALERAREQVKKYYPTVDDYADEIKAIIINEVRSAFDAGADSVQLDAPEILQFGVYGDYRESRSKDAVRSAVQLNNELLSSIPWEKIQVHACWGNLRNTQFNTHGHYDGALPELYDLKAGVIGPLEVFDGIRDFDELSYFRDYEPPKDKGLALGLVSVKTRNVEPVEVIRKRYQTAVEATDKDDLVVAPGCGFASDPISIHTLESAKRKLANMVKAVNGSPRLPRVYSYL